MENYYKGAKVWSSLRRERAIVDINGRRYCTRTTRTLHFLAHPNPKETFRYRSFESSTSAPFIGQKVPQTGKFAASSKPCAYNLTSFPSLYSVPSHQIINQ